MSWLKQSPSASSLKDNTHSTGRPRAASHGASAASRQQVQPHVTRILACGTVYITHTLSVPASLVQPNLSDNGEHISITTNARAKQVTRTRGGSAVNILSILAQFTAIPPVPPSRHQPTSRRGVIECGLVAPLGSDSAGRALMHELEYEGIRTRFCKVHPAGVPTAFVLRSDDTPLRTVINHNPLPDLTHEEFVSILGSILVPEHYQGLLSHHWHPHPSIPQIPPVHAVYGPGPGFPPITTLPINSSSSQILATGTPSSSNTPLHPSTPGLPMNAPFTLFHITGRAPAADAVSLLNVTGIDSLARDRFWRDKSTFSLDCTSPISTEEGRLARQQLFPHVDVIFFSKAYALSVNPSTPAQKLTPRSFLLSQVPLVASHALLLVHWEHDGSALLSVPTREYLQSSSWTDTTSKPIVEPLPNELQPDVRPGTQLSLGSDDPRYQEYEPLGDQPGAPLINPDANASIPDWEDVYDAIAWRRQPTSRSVDPSSMPNTDPTTAGIVFPNGGVLDHVEAQGHADSPGFRAYNHGFPLADAFEDSTPNSSWDYRANRTAVVYDSGDDETESDYGQEAPGGSALGLGLDGQGQMTTGFGMLIHEGIALSPSDVDSDLDANAAAIASRFVMEERIRRVYGPMQGDAEESDLLDYDDSEATDERGNDSDQTENGGKTSRPTRVGRLRKEKIRQQKEEEARLAEELRRKELEFDAGSIKSDVQTIAPPPPISPGVIEAWQAGLIYALTRHVLPGKPYCPPVGVAKGVPSKDSKVKKGGPSESDDWAWKWRLDECLRFAAELAGRRAKQDYHDGLAKEMEDNGWI